MVTRFDQDTAVTATGDGTYAARIDPGWWIERGPNGGYVAAVLVQALTAEVADADRHLRSLTVHYLAPAREGAAEVTVQTERAGRTISFLDARLQQGDRLIATARAAFAVQNSQSPAFADPTFPGYPPPETLEVRADPPGMIAMRERYQYHHVVGLPWEGPSDQAETGGWIRLREPRPYDAALVAALSDAWFPAIFTRLGTPMGVPTIDLTVHVRSVDALQRMRPEDSMAVRFRTTMLAEGYLEEDGELWAPDGTLVAHSRQLGLVLTG
ncbi:MAG: thioesterase family protein [Acidimicrobiales bacterium]